MARNRGLSCTDSQYLAFFDDDDLWDPSKLERQVDALREAPDAVGCHTQFDLIDTSGHLTGHGDVTSGSRQDILGVTSHILPPTLLLRRDAVDMAGWFNTGFPCAEDIELIYRLLRLGTFVFIDTPLYLHRRHNNNTTSDIFSVANASVEAMRIQRLFPLRDNDVAAATVVTNGLRRTKKYWASVAGHAAFAALRRGDLALSARYFRLVFQLAPSELGRLLATGALRRVTIR